MAEGSHMIMGILDLKKIFYYYYYKNNKNSICNLNKLLNNNELTEMGKEIVPCE